MRRDEIENPAPTILRVIDSLERFGKFDFKADGYVRIERMRKLRALALYRETLNGIEGRIEAESPSSTMVSSASVEWTAEKAEIGYNIRQRHMGIIRPEIRPMVDAWIKAGAPYPSGGGVYHTQPNKSYEKVKGLMDFPELRSAVLNLGLYEEWIRFWSVYLPLRYKVSAHLLYMLQNRIDPDALSRDNEEAGTGIYIRGMRPKRKELGRVASDLDFLLIYAFAMGVAFAATQIAYLPSDYVWVVTVYDPRIRGAMAARSDIDVVDQSWDGERLTFQCTSMTRQVGSDVTGLLANSKTERKILGSSVTEKVLRETRRRGVEYPFTAKRLLMDIWAADATPFPGKRYVIGEDLGLLEPVKSPADALFSRGFIAIGSKVLPMLLSGSSWTQAVYSVFHNHFITKSAADDLMMCLGDDMNLLTVASTDAMFAPYIKVKSTDPTKNVKKILGLYSVFSTKEDPEGKEQALIGVVPRVFKSVSSAHKRGSDWGDTLSNLPVKGTLELNHSARVEKEISTDLGAILPYLFWKGERSLLRAKLDALWGHVSPDIWTTLLRHNEELEYRLLPEEETKIADDD